MAPPDPDPHAFDAADPHAFLAAGDVALDLPLAGVGSRALAALVDGMVLMVVVTAMGVAAGVATGLVPAGVRAWVVAGTVVLMFLVTWGYFAVAEQLMGGQSPGKRLVGLRVVSAEGARVGLVASMLRNLLRIIDFMPGSYGLGVVVMMGSRRSRRLGDLAAGTLVVREPAAPPPRLVRTWPAGFSEDDVALVEAWFRREGALAPGVRAELAQRLVDWITATHPEHAAARPAGSDPVARVHALFRPAPGPAEAPADSADGVPP